MPDANLDGLPDFDGETYRRALDHERLGTQLLRVGRLMGDGDWRTLRQIAAATDDPEASVSARLRDLRKRKFGQHAVERERVRAGLYRYRIVLSGHENDDDWGEGQPVPIQPQPRNPEPVQLDIASYIE